MGVEGVLSYDINNIPRKYDVSHKLDEVSWAAAILLLESSYESRGIGHGAYLNKFLMRALRISFKQQQQRAAAAAQAA